MINSTAAQRLAFAISAAGVDPADLIRRSDYASEGEYYIALARAAEALDNPNVRRALLMVKQQEQDRAIEEARKAEDERIRERARTMELSDEQRDTILSRATEAAAKEYMSGDIDPKKTLAQRTRELAVDYEKQERNRIAGNEAANAAIRAAWREPTEADKAFVDRVVNRPTVDA